MWNLFKKSPVEEESLKLNQIQAQLEEAKKDLDSTNAIIKDNLCTLAIQEKTIKANKEYLSEIEGNPLYRKYGVRVKAKQNAVTGDIDKGSLELLELIDYSPKFDENYLESLISRAAPKWAGIGTDVWLANIREGMS